MNRIRWVMVLAIVLLAAVLLLDVFGNRNGAEAMPQTQPSVSVPTSTAIPVTPTLEPSPTPTEFVPPFDQIAPVYVSAAEKFIHLEDEVLVVDEVPQEVLDKCGDLTVKQAAALAVEVWREQGVQYGVPFDVWMALIASESGFHHWEVEGEKCQLNTNSAGAVGLTQIYRPSRSDAWYTPVHPEITLEELYNAKRALELGMRILVTRRESGWDNKVYGYKGGAYHQLYYDLKAQGGVRLDGEWISFDEGDW